MVFLVVDFVGREAELRDLQRMLAGVRESERGLLLAVRGRRQVGKSTLLERFVERAGAPHVFFAATQGATPESELAAFTREVGASSLEGADLFASARFDGWASALRELARSTSHPSVVVVDEFPYLVEGSTVVEGTVQNAWDRHLSKVPILLVLVGSDVSMMETLGLHGRPLFGRLREMVVDPLNLAEVRSALDLEAADAIDAFLLVGGFPRIVAEWRPGVSPARFVAEQLGDSTSPLVVVGERILNAEFPAGLQARDILTVIGSGETTFTTIRDRAGVNEGSLSRTLHVVVEVKRVVEVERPLSAYRSKLALYRVADPYLRFWLRFIGPNIELLLRGRGDVVARTIAAAWSEYRGRAVEPIVRRSIERLVPHARFGSAVHVGAFWTRRSDVQVDLVGADKPAAPANVAFVGSIKWRERSAFGAKDLHSLAALRGVVPGAADARLVGVSRAGFSSRDLDVALEPDDLVAAWRAR